MKKYRTLDNITITDEYTKVWIPCVDTDSFNYIPSHHTLKECISFGTDEFYFKESSCQDECDSLNSL